MRLRILVYMRPKTVKILLARKDKQWGGQKWLADQMKVSETYISLMLSGYEPVPTGRQSLLINAFRGMARAKGEKVRWDDIFQNVTRADGSVTASF